MSRKLVAYFSATGTTTKVAELLADAIGADIFEIQPEVPYSAADLDWKNPKSRSSVEMKMILPVLPFLRKEITWMSTIPFLSASLSGGM